ncbi:MAG: hypothetical protein M1450_03480 [Patescibacteria group bacterium]|nr:hypothetical protein [Patescibacteria group bacterium]
MAAKETRIPMIPPKREVITNVDQLKEQHARIFFDLGIFKAFGKYLKTNRARREKAVLMGPFFSAEPGLYIEGSFNGDYSVRLELGDQTVIAYDGNRRRNYRCAAVEVKLLSEFKNGRLDWTHLIINGAVSSRMTKGQFEGLEQNEKGSGRTKIARIIRLAAKVPNKRYVGTYYNHWTGPATI